MSTPFGFIARSEGNNNVTIDDANGVMHVTEIGSYTPSNNVEMSVYITFQRPVTSEAPPMVFLRPGDAGGCYNLGFVGGPGNWTACRFAAMGGNRSTGSYFLGVLAPSASGEQWGLRVWDGNHRLMYDSGLMYTQLTARLPGRTWSYLGKTRQGSSFFWTYEINNPNKDWYFLANPWCAGMRKVRSRSAGANVAPSGFTYILRHNNNARDRFQIQFQQLVDNWNPNFTEDFLMAIPRG